MKGVLGKNEKNEAAFILSQDRNLINDQYSFSYSKSLSLSFHYWIFFLFSKLIFIWIFYSRYITIFSFTYISIFHLQLNISKIKKNFEFEQLMKITTNQQLKMQHSSRFMLVTRLQKIKTRAIRKKYQPYFE